MRCYVNLQNACSLPERNSQSIDFLREKSILTNSHIPVHETKIDVHEYYDKRMKPTRYFRKW